MLRKVVILVTITIISLLLLCSCHSAKRIESFEMPSSFDYDKQYEISFWVKIDNNTVQKSIYEKAISDFEKLYPNVKVKLRDFYNYGDIYREVLNNVKTATTPNVCIAYPDHVATYLTGTNVVVPLQELIDDERFGLGGSQVRFDSVGKDEVVEKFLLEGQIQGVQYTLPFMRSTEACYINADLVRALGFEIPEVMTWDFIFEVSAKALEPVDYDENGNPIYINGQTVMVPFIYKSTDNMMIQMLKQNGYGFSTEDGEILLFSDDTKDLLYMVADKVGEKTLSTFDIENKYPGDLINAGKCIFGVDSTAGATWMGTNAPNVDIDRETIEEFEMVVTEIPQFNPDEPVMISQGPSICLFNKENDDEVLASWLFTQFLLTNQVQISYAQTEGYVPVTKRAQQSEEYLDYLSRGGENNDLYYQVKIDATKLLIDNIDNTFITPVFNGSASLREAAGMLIEETGKSVRRGQTVDEERLDTIFSRVFSIKRLDELTQGGETQDGPLPTTSVVLLCLIGVSWLGIGVYGLVVYVKKRKIIKNS